MKGEGERRGEGERERGEKRLWRSLRNGRRDGGVSSAEGDGQQGREKRRTRWWDSKIFFQVVGFEGFYLFE